MNIGLLKKLSTLMKYTMFGACIIMTAHVVCLLCGKNYFFAEWFCGFSVLGFAMLFIASYVLDYDNMFRALLIYDFAINQCIVFQRSFQFFGEYLTTARMIAALSGIILIILFLLNTNSYKENDTFEE